jgi:2-oxoglutarate/2-oxoacid ferredoxin oxidoreductase subunit alpha
VKKKGGPPFGTDDEDGVPPMPSFGEGEKLLVTGSTHDEMGIRKTDDPLAHEKLVSRINKKILNRREQIIQTESYHLEDAKCVVVAYGFTARSALYAVNKLRGEGGKTGLLRLKTIWPFPDLLFQELGKRVGKIFIPEMNRGQVAGEIMKHADCDVIPFIQTNGEIIEPHTIIDEVKGIL